MRRALLITVGLVALTTLALFLAPPFLLTMAERQLARSLDAQVAIGDLELGFRFELPWLELRVHDTQIEARSGGALSINALRADLNLPALVIGQLRFRDAELTGVRATLPPTSAGATTSAVAPPLAPLGALLTGLRNEPCVLQSLRIEKLDVLRRAAEGKAKLLRDLHGAFKCEAKNGRGRTRIEGALAQGVVPGASFRIEAQATAGLVEAGLKFAALDLQPGVALLGIESPLTGLVDGVLRWRAPDAGPSQVELELDARLAFPNGAATTRVARAQATFEVPFEGKAKLHATLHFDQLGAGDIGSLLEQLPPELRETAGPLLQRFERGTLRDLQLEIQSHADELAELIARGPLARPGELALRTRLEGGQLRIGAGDRLSGIEGALRFEADQVMVTIARARFGNAELPQLDLTLNGVSHLQADEGFRCEPVVHVEPLPGLAAFNRWRISRKRPAAPGSTPNWRRTRLELEFVRHPVLFCALRDIVAELRPGNAAGSLAFELPRARLGALPLSLRGVFEKPGARQKPAKLALVVALGEASEAPPPALPAPPDSNALATESREGKNRKTESVWGRGRFRYEARRLGHWRIEGIEGRLHARGTRLQLDDLALQLRPGERVKGQLELEFGAAGDAQFSADLQLADHALLDLWQAAGVESGRLSGQLHGAVSLRGPLRPGKSSLAEAEGTVTLNARAGNIDRRIPLMLAIALASERFNPFGDRDQIRYEAIDLVGRVEAGVLHAQNATLHSPILRGAASGSAMLSGKGELDVVLGIFFLPRIDNLLEKIPVLSRVVLGNDNNLIGAYFSVKGELKKPKARLAPLRSLAKGPAGVVLEMPMRILGGMKAIQEIVLPRKQSKTETPQSLP